MFEEDVKIYYVYIEPESLWFLDQNHYGIFQASKHKICNLIYILHSTE